MEKKYIIAFIGFIIFLIVVFSSVAIYSNSNGDNKILDKLEEEISFIEQRLIEMMNALNDISFNEVVLTEEKSSLSENNSEDSSQESTENTEESGSSKESSKKEFSKFSISQKNILTTTEIKTNWEFVKNTAENLYSTWTTVIVDLHSVNVNNEDILNFSDKFNMLIVYVEQENKIQTLNTLLELYSYIPKYIEQTINDVEKINLAYTKLNVLNSYVLAEEEKWDEMKSKINLAQEYYEVIINSLTDKKNQSKLSNIYVSLNEIKNAVNYKDKKLYYVKYTDLMEKLFDF